MKNRIKALITGASAFAFLTVPAQAHTMWINVIPEFDKHVLAAIAYGDAMSGSELLTPDWWPMYIAEYDVIDPEGTRTALGVPQLVTKEKQKLSSGMEFQAGGDTGRRKFVIKPDTLKGTYQLYATTPVAHVINYMDKDGKPGFIDANLTKLPKGVKVTKEKLGVNLMKASFSVGAWSDPEPVGMPLEIVPLTDLHKTRVGDVVRFKVMLNGETLSDESHIVAYNMSFGDRWGLFSELKHGEGEFRVPVAGLWRVDVAYQGSSNDVDAYKSDKELPISIESSFVFNIKP